MGHQPDFGVLPHVEALWKPVGFEQKLAALAHAACDAASDCFWLMDMHMELSARFHGSLWHRLAAQRFLEYAVGGRE